MYFRCDRVKNKKRKIVFGCYFCGKGVSEEELHTDKKGYVTMSNSPQLTDRDNHFICKNCFSKIQKYFDMKIKT